LVKDITKMEDLKGNPKEEGWIRITNLRMIWRHSTKKWINISIGYDTI